LADRVVFAPGAFPEALLPDVPETPWSFSARAGAEDDGVLAALCSPAVDGVTDMRPLGTELRPGSPGLHGSGFDVAFVAEPGFPFCADAIGATPSRATDATASNTRFIETSTSRWSKRRPEGAAATGELCRLSALPSGR
jgi:hypothetical protein